MPATAQQAGAASANNCGSKNWQASYIDTLRAAVESGDATAQNNLGVTYLQGCGGVEADFPTAAAWFRKAADQGNAVAQYNLGVMYANGSIGKQDLDTATDLLRKAADQGVVEAKWQLSILDSQRTEEENRRNEAWQRDALGLFLLLAGLVLVVSWACGALLFVYTPIKLITQESAHAIWTFLSYRRLIIMALIWCVGAPFPLLIAAFGALGGISGSGGMFKPTYEYFLLYLYLAAAAVSLVLIPIRAIRLRSDAALTN